MPVILLTVFIDLLGFGLIIPILPFLTLKYGGTAFDGTALMSIYSLAAFASGPLWGRFSDRFGRRPALIATLVGASLSYLALAFSDSLTMLYVARGMSGLMAGNIGIVMAIAADLSDDQNRGKTMGQVGAMFGLGFAFGPLIGGLLGSQGGEPSILMPGLVAASLSFIALVLTYYFVPETSPDQSGNAKEAVPHWSKALKAPGTLMLYGIFIVTAIGQSTSFSITPFWAQAVLGWNEADVGFLYAGVGLAIAFSQSVLTGPLFRHFGEAKTLMGGAVVHMTGCFLLIFGAGTVTNALIALPMVLTGLTLSFPALNSLLSRRTDKRLQGTALGMSNGLSAFGRVMGPISAGSLFTAISPAKPFVLVAATGLITFLWGAYEVRRTRAR